LLESKVYEIFYNAIADLVRNVDETLAATVRIVNKEKILQSELMKQFKRHLHLKQAENLEKAGRYEDATQIYERHGIYKRLRN